MCFGGSRITAHKNLIQQPRCAGRNGIDLRGALNNLLVSAQRAGAVRADVNHDDVKALMTSCLSRASAQDDPGACDRMVAIATAGLRAPSAAD